MGANGVDTVQNETVVVASDVVCHKFSDDRAQENAIHGISRVQIRSQLVTRVTKVS